MIIKHALPSDIKIFKTIFFYLTKNLFFYFVEISNKFHWIDLKLKVLQNFLQGKKR